MHLHRRVVLWLLLVPLLLSAAQKKTAVDVNSLLQQAMALKEQKKNAEAEALFSQAVEHSFEPGPIYLQRGLVRSAQGKKKDALIDFEMAVTYLPDNASAFYYRGGARRALEDHAGAAADYGEAAKREPKNPRIHFDHASALHSCGKYPEALIAINQAIELAPERPEHFATRAAIKEKQGQIDEALADADKAVALGQPGKLRDSIRQARDRIAARKDGRPAEGSLLGQPRTLPRSPAPESITGKTAAVPAGSGALASTAAPIRPTSRESSSAAPAATRAAPTPPAPTTNHIASLPPLDLPPPSGGVVPIALPAPMDLGNLTREQWAGLVSQTKEGLAMIYGKLGADQQKAFDAQWAPFFDHPSVEVVGYFSKLSPLVSECVALREAISGTAVACDSAQFQLTSALAGDDREAAVSHSYHLKQLRGLLAAQSARMTQLSEAVVTLGPLPDVKDLKAQAKKRHHKIVQDLIDPFPFEGTWEAVNPPLAGDNPHRRLYALEVLTALPDQSLLCQGGFGKATTSSKLVLQPLPTPGQWLLFDMSYQEATESREFGRIVVEGEVMHVQSYYDDNAKVSLGEFGVFKQYVFRRTGRVQQRHPNALKVRDDENKPVDVDWAKAAQTRAQRYREQIAIVKRGSLDPAQEDRRRRTWAETNAESNHKQVSDRPYAQGSVDAQHLFNDQYYKYGSRPPGFDNPLPAPKPDLEARRRRENIIIWNYQKEIARKWQISLDVAKRDYSDPEQKARYLAREEKDVHKLDSFIGPAIKKRLDEEMPATAATSEVRDIMGKGIPADCQIPVREWLWWTMTHVHSESFFGGSGAKAKPPAPPPPPPIDPAVAAAKAAEAQAAAAAEKARQEKMVMFKEEIAGLEKSIEWIERDRSAVSPGDKDFERKMNDYDRQLLGYRASMSAAQDQIRFLETGVYERTRTPADDLNRRLMEEDGRAMANYWENVNRKLDRMERLIEVAPEDRRNDLRHKWNDDVAAAIANGARFDALDRSAKEIGESILGTRREEGRKAEADAAAADAKLAIAEKVKTASDYAMTGITIFATAGIAAPVSLIMPLCAESALSTGYSVVTGYIEGGPVEAFKRCATSYSQVAGLVNTAMESYQRGVLDHLEEYARDPQKVPLNERGAGLSSMAWALGEEGAKMAAMHFVVTPACVSLKEAMKAPKAPAKSGGGIFGEEPVRFKTAGELKEAALFRQKDLQGKHLMNKFRAANEEIKTARAAGKTAAELAPLQAKAEAVYKEANSDFHAKNWMKRVGKLDPEVNATWCELDAVNKSKLVETTQQVLGEMGLSNHELRSYSNSASKGKVGMDVDLGFVEPQRWLVITEGGTQRTIVNPEYWKWRNGLTRKNPATGQVEMIHPSEYSAHAKQAMNEAYKRVYGHPPDEAFLEFTFRDHPEAYKDMRWLGQEKSAGAPDGPPWADFANINPAWVRQAGDVTAFKVKRLQKGPGDPQAPSAPPTAREKQQQTQSALGAGHDEMPSMPTYSRMLEQCRGLMKDFDTKMFGAEANPAAFGNEAGLQITINPNAPLGQVPKPVQQHFVQLREVLSDFSNGRIGPVETERKLNVLTGGKGIIEVPEQMQAILAKYQPPPKAAR